MNDTRTVVSSRVPITVLLSLAAVSGCTQYQSKPLSDEAVRNALASPDERALRVEIGKLQHPILKPMEIDLSRGLTPDEAAVVAVVVNPELRAERDARGVAAAQLLQAGLLPNPQLVGGIDFPYHSSPPDNFTAYTIGPEWEITSLITREAKRRAAAAEAQSVELDIAWKEWQTAQEARAAAYDLLAINVALAAAREAQQQANQDVELIRRAVDRHDRTLSDLTTAEAAAQDAHATVLSQEHDLNRQKLALNRALGLPNDVAMNVREDGTLPSRLSPPTGLELLDGMENRRLDLLALKKGYESEDQTLRAAILAQFPKISLGFNAARDTSNVKTIGLGVTMDIPIFDRNQGAIATETATRQKLFDEYAARVFAARADVAAALQDIADANAQIAAAEAAIPNLEKVSQAYQAALGQGNVDALTAHQARAALWQKRIDLVKLKQQLVQNWIALELAAGRYLPLESLAATTQEARR